MSVIRFGYQRWDIYASEALFCRHRMLNAQEEHGHYQPLNGCRYPFTQQPLNAHEFVPDGS